jgi:carboxypeptidase Q
MSLSIDDLSPKLAGVTAVTTMAEPHEHLLFHWRPAHMQRFLATTLALAVTCLMPALAIRAQEPPRATPSAQPAAKAAATTAETTPSTDPIERIKDEGMKRSQVMATLSYLTDVIGPRLTGSPNLKRANEWTRDKLAAWGLANAHLEAWGPFGRGWSLKRFSAQITEPQCIPLIGFPKAWSTGTDGVLEAPVVYFDAKTDTDFAKFKGKLKGAIVLTSPVREVAAHFEPLANRKTDSELLALADAAEPNARGIGRRAALAAQGQPQGPGQGQGQRRGGTPPAPAIANGAPAAAAATAPGAAAGNQPAAAQARMGRFGSPEMRAQFELMRKKTQFLVDEQAAMLVEPSTQGDGGTFFVMSASVPGAPLPTPGQTTRRVSVYDKDAPKIIPQVVLAKEHYNRLVRMCEQGEHLKMAVELAVQFHDDDLMAYNTVAEIPGTDLKQELVMLGGHMDSWHSGTGATDNGAGVSCAMEAVRILKALDLKPRRTIRIALWSGEEEGLLGSRAFVKEHFGRSPMNMFGTPPPAEASKDNNGAAAKESSESSQKADYANFSAYYNLDNGTGKIRGVYMQGNDSVRPIFRKWLQPFREMGATTLTISNTGGTDHQSFDGIGLPGFQFIQDEIEYDSRTHHSNQDVFDRIQGDDMKQASTIMAAFVYNTAMMDEKLPRKPATTTPETRGATAGRAAAP